MVRVVKTPFFSFKSIEDILPVLKYMFFTGGEELSVRGVSIKKLVESAEMVLTHGALQSFELLQIEGDIETEDKSFEGDNLLRHSRVCGFGINVEQYMDLLCAGEHYAIEASSTQSTSWVRCVATSCFVLHLFDKPKGFQKASS